MKRLMRGATVFLLVAASAPSLAFVRSTSVEGRPDQGLWLWWRPRQVPFNVNRSTFDKIPGCGSAADAAAGSFPSWTAQGTNFTYRDGGDTAIRTIGNDGTNLVVVRQGRCADFAPSDANCRSSTTIGQCIEAHNCWSHADDLTLALTTVNFNTATGEIVDADMELHGWDGTASRVGFFFTCSSPPAAAPCNDGQTYTLGASCIGFDLANTVTHEAGHVLGLDHVCELSYPAPYNACNAEQRAATMFPSAQQGDVGKRTLGADDIAGVSAIYPAGQPTVTSPLPSSPSSSGGCSASGGGALSLLGLALLLWRRLRPVARA